MSLNMVSRDFPEASITNTHIHYFSSPKFRNHVIRERSISMLFLGMVLLLELYGLLVSDYDYDYGK